MSKLTQFFKNKKFWKTALTVSAIAIFLVGAVSGLYFYLQNRSLILERDKSNATITQISAELETIQSEDPYKTNAALKKEIDQIQKTFAQSVVVYESLLDLENPPKNIRGLDDIFANVLAQLGKRDFTTAGKTLNDLTLKIRAEEDKIAAASQSAVSANLPVSNAPPASSGSYSRQKVTTEAGDFQVDIIAGDLSNTRVIVDTASDSTCADNCPVLPLATYVSRSGAFAGVNGTYFCPASYPTCVGKTNSFDLLLMNKNKVYFNSDNNVYSNNPAVVFGSGYVRFMGAASEWGRDTGIDGMLSNYPLLVAGGNVSFGGNSDPKQGSKGNRSFVSNKGNTVYIGVVRNATTAESARVMKAMGMENALNLDDGGSTALFSGGYKIGPGRDLPNAILFVRK